ncbi:MAG: 7-carboxy-7-deazaguanine synthase QueE [Polyangiaceae bacterium]
MSKRLALLEGKPAGSLVIHEIYRSLQGESTYVGLPFVFVRLSVCDARCVWCDTPHAFQQGETLPLDEVVARVLEHRTAHVLVTGGEPLLQPEVLPLMTRLADAGLEVLLETSGAHDVSAVDERVVVVMDLKCPDSGEVEHNRYENLAVLGPRAQIKFVVASRGDFDWAVDRCREHDLAGRFEVLFSPVFGAVAPRDLAAWLLASDCGGRLQLQLHKQIWDPSARGV